MSNDRKVAKEEALCWSTPKLDRLDVDLKSIATGTPNTTDTSPGAHTS